METKVKHGLQTLRRAHAFLDGKELSAALGELAPHVETLNGVIARLEAYASEQEARESAARAATEMKREMARELRGEFLRPIALVARSLFADDPEIRAAFRVPGTRDDEGLIHAGRVFAQRMGDFQEKFAARGFTVDVVERLRAASDALREQLTERALDRARRVAATAGLLAELSRGRDLLRLLDLMLAPRLANSSAQLAEWRSISHVWRRARARQEKESSVAGAIVPAAPDTLSSAA